MDIYASLNWVNLGSGNGLSQVQRQAITWTKVDLLSVRFCGIHYKAISMEMPCPATFPN